MKQIRKVLLILLTITLCLGLGCVILARVMENSTAADNRLLAGSASAEALMGTTSPPLVTDAPTPSPVPTPTPFPEYDISLMAVGDNLMHMGVIYTGKQADGSYD